MNSRGTALALRSLPEATRGWKRFPRLSCSRRQRFEKAVTRPRKGVHITACEARSEAAHAAQVHMNAVNMSRPPAIHMIAPAFC